MSSFFHLGVNATELVDSLQGCVSAALPLAAAFPAGSIICYHPIENRPGTICPYDR
jgi:hypothetical protein